MDEVKSEKKGLGLLIGLSPKKPGDSEAPVAGPPDEGMDEVPESPKELAAQGVMDALESKDRAAFADALATFVEACGMAKD